MSERREDPFTGRSVVIAPERRGLGGARPGGLPLSAARCPFCPGHEADAEPTVAAWPSESAWRVRVVRNKYPVVTGGGQDHEVGVDAREHDVDLPDLEVEHAAAMLGLYRARVAELESRPGVQAVLLFRNRGRRAGSSQPHPHTQIAALGWVPFEVALRWDRARRFAADGGRPLHEVELERELGSERIVAADEQAVAFCPFAPSRPYEVRIAPRVPAGGFSSAREAQLGSVARLLVDVTGRLTRRAGVTDYNLVLRQPPVGAAGPAAAWHLELLPRMGGDAGFELGTGEAVVVVAPEEAAERLRG